MQNYPSAAPEAVILALADAADHKNISTFTHTMTKRKEKEYDQSTVKGRLLTYLQHKGISQTLFSERMGVSPTYIGAMRKGLSLNKLQKLSEHFPDLNREWLMYGSGQMLVSETEEPSVDVKQYEVPMLPVSAYAGNLQMWSNGVRSADCEKVMAPVPDADFAIRISGDSMEPRFHDGSVILIKRINEKAFIPWGNPMVIDTENGVLVKVVLPGSNDSLIEARSVNTIYPPLQIPTESIYGIYRIVGAISFYNTL